MNTHMPQAKVLWYQEQFDQLPALSKTITVDFVIVGGGMAGLIAAYHARKRGYSVALLEKSFCGGGASGKSSGFITPDSEWELSHFEHKFGAEKAQKLWDFALSGCHDIAHIIQEYSVRCDYQKQDTLIVALNNRGFTHIKEEYEYRKKAGYQSQLHTEKSLMTHLGAQGYLGGVQYGDTFGINPYQFCQNFKKILCEQGVLIFENTEVIGIDNTHVATRDGHVVKAEHVVVCVDRWAPHISCFTDTVSQVQTILTASAPLTDAQVAQLFPVKSMVWDTSLIYTYYRLTGDKRLLLGGADLCTTYTSTEQWHANRIINKLRRYARTHFSTIPLTFEYAWPGLIGVSKDIMPVAGFDCVKPSVYGIAAASGLPWAAALGRYSIERIIDNHAAYDEFFSPKREFPLGSVAQKIVGKKLAFMFSHGIVEFF